MTNVPLRMSLMQVSLGPVVTVSHWLTRRRMRKQLLELDDEQLIDVGLDREVVLSAANKPFWLA
jgi:uncharacterized protein YjiS (DUF1127 family)